jgi:hypothetical protein
LSRTDHSQFVTVILIGQSGSKSDIAKKYLEKTTKQQKTFRNHYVFEEHI